MTTYRLLHNLTSRFDEYTQGDVLDHVYTGYVVYTDENESEAALLNEIYEIFNINHPADYQARSLSVGDVVEINGRQFAVSRVGFKRIHPAIDPLTNPNTLEAILDRDAEATFAEHFDAYCESLWQRNLDALNRQYAETEVEREHYELTEYEQELRGAYHGAGVEYADDFESQAELNAEFEAEQWDPRDGLEIFIGIGDFDGHVEEQDIPF